MQRNEKRKTHNYLLLGNLHGLIDYLMGSPIRELLLGGEAMAHLPEQDTNIAMMFGYNFVIFNPCKDCTDREVGCHGKCDKYAQYRTELERSKAIRKKYATIKGVKNGWN